MAQSWAWKSFTERPGKVKPSWWQQRAVPAISSAEATKYMIREVEHPQRSPLGTDLAIRIARFRQGLSEGRARRDPVTPEPLALLLKLPNRATTRNPSIPSDWVNIALPRHQEALIKTFEADTWSPAALASPSTNTRLSLPWRNILLQTRRSSLSCSKAGARCGVSEANQHIREASPSPNLAYRQVLEWPTDLASHSHYVGTSV